MSSLANNIMSLHVPLPTLTWLLACIPIACAIYCTRGRTSSLPVPPGPPPRGLLGNLHDIPSVDEAETYAKWGQKYGPVVHYRVLNRHVVVLNTIEAAVDLLDRRSSIYSDRPRLPMLVELMGWYWNMGLQPYGETWRSSRRIMHNLLNVRVIEKYRDLQTRTNAAFLRALLDAPSNFWAHIRRGQAAMIMALAYGIAVAPQGDDPWVTLAEESVESIGKAGIPGTYMVDWIPFLRYIPDWFPGATFKRKAREWRKLSVRMVSVPFARVQSEMREGVAPPSIAADLLQNGLQGTPVPVQLARDVAGVFYVAGVDTTASALSSFFFAMTIFPEQQKKAQEELDRVIGFGARLPEFSDRGSLPYVDALLLEVLRMFPVAPLNLPRRVMEEDEYNGMRIPKGATVLTNIWAILRDERDYPNPETFHPERFLKDGELNKAVRDPRTVHFGIGRRACSGVHFADASMWLAIVTVLACFNIAPVKNEDGEDLVPQANMSSGLVSCPAKFHCTITPRSDAAKDLVFAASEQA